MLERFGSRRPSSKAKTLPVLEGARRREPSKGCQLSFPHGRPGEQRQWSRRTPHCVRGEDLLIAVAVAVATPDRLVLYAARLHQTCFALAAWPGPPVLLPALLPP